MSQSNNKTRSLFRVSSTHRVSRYAYSQKVQRLCTADFSIACQIPIIGSLYKVQMLNEELQMPTYTLPVMFICLLSLSARSETNDTSERPESTASQLTYAGNVQGLESGIVDIINNSRGHYQYDIQVSNGEFQIGFYTLQVFLYSYWFAVDDTATFTTDLYAALANSYTPGRYQYVDISKIRNSEETLGQSVFTQANVGWDFDNDGNVSSDEELDVVDGTIDVTGTTINTMHITFGVLLSNGERATGAYSSPFELME